MLNKKFKPELSNVQLDKVYACQQGGAQKKQVEQSYSEIKLN